MVIAMKDTSHGQWSCFLLGTHYFASSSSIQNYSNIVNRFNGIKDIKGVATDKWQCIFTALMITFNYDFGL